MHGYNFTERVRKVLTLAREEASRLDHDHVEPEHLLLGLISERSLPHGGSVATVVLANLGVDLEKLSLTLAPMRTAEGALRPISDLPYSSKAKKILEVAMTEARELGHSYIGTEHLLLSVLRVEGPASRALNDAGVTTEVARAEVLRQVGTPLWSSEGRAIRTVHAYRDLSSKDLLARVVAAIALAIAVLALVITLSR